MSDLAWELMKLWVLWYSSAAMFGAFVGCMLAFGVKALYNKHKNRRKRG